ncbi:hypothetical protein [Bombilactobacillus mellis]|uniref:hypothetical protein n=1 Tax=Bombilactobacillus mellis TaxID=1218508 RepID=UPI00157FD0FB|nr:hypothetical protein [Bombilactobacillus mellis]NUF26332.1 hypothetical protein [Bombilactobacillus mellis]
MTIAEYWLRLEAYQLKQAKTQEQLALQAWLNQAVKATRGNSKHPKPKYKTFKEFYDLEQVNSDIRATFEGGKTQKQKKLGRNELIAKRYNEWQKIKNEKKGGKHE